MDDPLERGGRKELSSFIVNFYADANLTARGSHIVFDAASGLICIVSTVGLVQVCGCLGGRC